MMLDEPNPRERVDGRAEPAARPRPSRPAESVMPIQAVPMADREVPIELARTPDMVHAWLDGELSLSAVRGPEWARHVEFWSQVDQDVEERRQIHAPAGLVERIMAALPEASPRLVTPWWGRRVTMNPVAMAILSAGLVALGAAIGATLRR